MDHFSDLYLTCYSIASVLYFVVFFFFFLLQSMWDLSPPLGTDPTLPTLEGEVLTPGPPGKSPGFLPLTQMLEDKRCRCRKTFKILRENNVSQEFKNYFKFYFLFNF